VLAYVAQRAVEDFGWLRAGEMIDGLALAETTPGPLILVLQFVGFVAAHRFPGGLDPWTAAVLGALLTTWVTFVPSFLFIFAGAPWIEALQRHRGLQSALAGVTAAVVGVIANLASWFALHTMFAASQSWQWGVLQLELPQWRSFQPVALLLAAAAVLAVLRWRIGLGPVLLGSALLSAGWMRMAG
jgi:chromate transporter